jgi:protoporphyrinogen oxidase
MTTRQVETVILGGGLAGLALSYYLKQDGCEHVVLDWAPAVGMSRESKP